MIGAFTYIIEVSLTLIGLYLIYLLLLRQEPFLQFNRFYLLAVILLSFLVPIVQLDLSAGAIIPAQVTQVSTQFQATFQDLTVAAEKAQMASAKLWIYVLFIGYCIGVVYCYVRFGMIVTAINNLMRNGHVIDRTDYFIVQSDSVNLPFSFLKYVFANEKSMLDQSFDQILAHEKVHIEHRHSTDLIIMQLIAPLLWFHPLMWRLIQSIKANHEYIVDKQIIKQGYSSVEYQSLLLGQLISNNSYGLVHNFNLSFVKKRIAMMDTKRTKMTSYLKLTCAIIALFTTLIAWSQVFPQMQQVAKADQGIKAEIVIDGKLSPTQPWGPAKTIELTALKGFSENVQLRFEASTHLKNQMTELDGKLVVVLTNFRAYHKMSLEVSTSGEGTIDITQIIPLAESGDDIILMFSPDLTVSNRGEASQIRIL